MTVEDSGRIRGTGTPVGRQGAGATPTPGEVKTSFNLEDFVCCSRARSQPKPSVPFLRVGTHGDFTIGAQIGQNIPVDSRVEIHINKKGNILLFWISDSPDRCGSAVAIKRHLEKCGVALPAIFLLEPGEGANRWIGRLHK
jgi:hypothetical protein